MVRTTRPNQRKAAIANRDTFLRINYMYQAVHLVLTQNPNNMELIRYYAYTLRTMAEKQVLRLHPNIKRTVCKKCCMLLVPGVTATVRKFGRKQPLTSVKCMACHTPKRFPSSAQYRLWSVQPHAWFAMFPPEVLLPTTAPHSQEQPEDMGSLEDRKSTGGACKERLRAHTQADRDPELVGGEETASKTPGREEPVRDKQSGQDGTTACPTCTHRRCRLRSICRREFKRKIIPCSNPSTVPSDRVGKKRWEGQLPPPSATLTNNQVAPMENGVSGGHCNSDELEKSDHSLKRDYPATPRSERIADVHVYY